MAVQELCVIEDLLFLVLNLDGKHFSFHHTESGLKHVIFVDESIDASILNRLKPVLKAAYCASRIGEFIQNQTRIGASVMMQSLASALDGVLKDFFQVAMALDKKFKGREVGLHQFCLHLSPFTRNLQSLLHLTFAIESGDVRGGALLRLLEEKVGAVSGDRQLKNTYSILLEGCARPFLGQLNFWLQNGSLSRDFSDFMIRSNNSATTTTATNTATSATSSSGDLQDSRYVLNPACCPHMLEDLSAKVLNVGTYRHLQGILSKKDQIQGINVAACLDETLRWDRRSLQEAINTAYQGVNVALMNSLFQSSKLFDAMCATKRFFFVQSSDFINNFLSSATEELNSPAKDTSPHQLQLSFEAALKNSTLASDAFAEAFRVEFASSSLYDGLVKIIQDSNGGQTSSASASSAAITKSPKVVDLFNLSMKVDFPESLIMNSKALAKYQLLFRHIFQCSELIRGLSVSLNLQRSLHRCSAAQLRQFEVMKAAMLQFVRTVHYYVCFGVLEPHWERFAGALKERRFTSIDEITDTHMDFLDTCLRECMLTNSKLVQLLGMTWSTCSKFSSLVADLNGRVGVGAGVGAGAFLNEHVFAEVMVKFSALHGHFCKYVKVLIEALQYYAARDCDHYIANFLSSLDCQYYS